jgi:hypothetical protein
LDLYKVTYKEVHNNYNKEEMRTIKYLPCTLWPKYQCITLSQLEKKKGLFHRSEICITNLVAIIKKLPF